MTLIWPAADVYSSAHRPCRNRPLVPGLRMDPAGSWTPPIPCSCRLAQPGPGARHGQRGARSRVPFRRDGPDAAHAGRTVGILGLHDGLAISAVDISTPQIDPVPLLSEELGQFVDLRSVGWAWPGQRHRSWRTRAGSDALADGIWFCGVCGARVRCSQRRPDGLHGVRGQHSPAPTPPSLCW